MTCARHKDHVWKPDGKGVTRCARPGCRVKWVDAVRGFGAGGDLPGKKASISDRMNREGGIG